MSLDRLIDLAKRTGDRLIVHDPIRGRDIVIMGIDVYEQLVMDKGMDMYLEEDDMSNDSSWHSAGDVLSDRYRGAAPAFGDDNPVGKWTPDDVDEERDRAAEQAEIEREIESQAQINRITDELNKEKPKETNPDELAAGKSVVPPGEPLPPEEIFYEEPIV